MNLFKVISIIFLLMAVFCQTTMVIAFDDHVDGLEYVVRRIEAPPIERTIAQRYDLYEFYLENRSDKTFSITGYSIDLGVHYSSLAEIKSLSKNKNSNKLAIFGIAAGAASFALGGIAKTAANTIKSVNSYKRNKAGFDDDENILSKNKTYIIYPSDGLSLFLFVDKNLAQSPNTVRFVCRDETSGINNVVINNHLDLREMNANGVDQINRNNEEAKKSVIAVPSSDTYK